MLINHPVKVTPSSHPLSVYVCIHAYGSVCLRVGGCTCYLPLASVYSPVLWFPTGAICLTSLSVLRIQTLVLSPVEQQPAWLNSLLAQPFSLSKPPQLDSLQSEIVRDYRKQVDHAMVFIRWNTCTTILPECCNAVASPSHFC